MFGGRYRASLQYPRAHSQKDALNQVVPCWFSLFHLIPPSPNDSTSRMNLVCLRYLRMIHTPRKQRDEGQEMGEKRFLHRMTNGYPATPQASFSHHYR